MTEPSGTTDRVFCPRCGRKYAVPGEEVKRRGGLRFRATCRTCGTLFRVFWDEGQLRTAAEEETETLGERDVLPKGGRVGKYEIEEALASGGSSTVYRTFDFGANRQVALKVLHRPAHGDDAMRFRREVEVQGNLKHPNLMPIFDHGTAEGKPYYTMELLHKPMTLDTIVGLYRAGRLPYHAGLRSLNSLRALLHQVVLPVARAIGFANRHGVIHRDLKPSNVMVDARTLRVYVIDFGICHLARTAGSRLVLRAGETHEEEDQRRLAMGTLRCMPPEQARGEVSPQGDVWALGALVRFVLTGDLPIAPALDFDRVSLEKRVRNLERIVASCRDAGDETEAAFYDARLEELRTGEHRSLKELLRDAQQANYAPLPDGIDPVLAAIVERAMAVEPKDRYASAEDLAADIQGYLDGRAVRAYAARLGPAGATIYKARLFGRRNRPALLAAAAAAAIVAVAGALFLMRAAAQEESRVRQLLAAARAAEDPAVQEARLTELLVLRPAHLEAEELLATVRRFAPLKAEIEKAREQRALLTKLRGDRRITDEAIRDAEAMAAVLELRTIPNLEALPSDFPGRALVDEARGLASQLRGTRIVAFRNLPRGVEVVLAEGAPVTREIDWESAKLLGTAPLTIPDRALQPGTYVLLVRYPDGKRTLYLPFAVSHRTADRLQLDCPLDPRELPDGMVYVPGAEAMEVGDPRFTETTERVEVEPFLLDECEVTNAQYRAYLNELDPALRRRAVPRRVLTGGGTAPLWTEQPDGAWDYPEGAARFPVTNISLLDAEGYARWAGKRLPTPSEWERAARGIDRRDYPFGMELDPAACNAHTGTVAEVGSFPRDRSPFGALDLGGNVAEWTAGGPGQKGTAKGGSFDLPRYRALAASFQRIPADEPMRDVGFRCAKDVGD